MLEVKGISNGIVLDHIPSGKGLKVFNKLYDINAIEERIVLLMNVESKQLGKKDIIKIENRFDVDLNVLGLIDPRITVNVIKDNKVVDKMVATIPEKIKGAIKCKNPRCITHSDDYAIPEFVLISSNGRLEYECSYCEEITKIKI